jgi:hypothetical protein
MSNKINNDIARMFFLIKKQKLQNQIEKRVFNLLIWCSTECSDEISWSRNKHYGQRYWSKQALELFLKNKGKVFGVGLVHEHAVPKSVLIKEINNCRTELEINNILNVFCKAVIITKAEDVKLNKKFKSKMPMKNWKKKDLLFSRYSECGIRIIDLKISRTTDIPKELGKIKSRKDINKYRTINSI